MSSALRIKYITLAAVACGMGISALGALTLSADEASRPNAAQSQAMATLIAPPSGENFAVADDITHQTPPQETFASLRSDCVSSLDEYLAPIVIPFDVGRADIDATHAPLLSHIADLLASCEGATLQIAGHADGDGSDRDNLALSWARADETLGVLVRLGADSASLEPLGFGARAPVSQGSDSDDDANRRVDFRVVAKRPAP